jgi:RNA-directed DNA polymerase
MSLKPTMHGSQKSDGPVLPTKPPNNIASATAEAVEGRRPAKGNTVEQNAARTQRRRVAPSALDRVRQAARKDRKAKFTALLHHVTLDRLRVAYKALARLAAAGVDGVTWVSYGEGLEARLVDLHARLHRGAYRAKPSRRVYIPKLNGRQRPLGVAALEDKIVQRAVVEVLNAIYETDFVGFSYGVRPRRSQHHALDALATGILRKKVNWVFEADIRGFFDAIDHGWMVRFLKHRIADRRVVRLIQKWLAAGVIENGKWSGTVEGTPQGATISPLLANVYLHYVLDLWVEQWRKRYARGDVVIVRYADDFVLGFEHEADACRFHHDLDARLRQFHLELHPDKTRLFRFGQFAAERQRERGLAKPVAFDFLGFTHICGKSRAGRFVLFRHTSKKRMRAKLRSLRDELRRRMHLPVVEQGKWLATVVRGYFAYHAVPTNARALSSFRYEAVRHWHRALRRRGQRGRIAWERTRRMADRWIPPPHILHPWPDERFDVRTQGKSRVR